MVSLIGHERLAEHLDLVSNRIVDPMINLELKKLARESLRGIFSNRSSLADEDFRELFTGINAVCDLRIGQLLHRAATLSRRQDELRELLATRVKRIQVKPFMDINTMLEERLLQCCVHVGTQSSASHQCVPFCAAQAWPELSSMKVGADQARIRVRATP